MTFTLRYLTPHWGSLNIQARKFSKCPSFIIVRKQSLRRLCFYTFLSVHGGGWGGLQAHTQWGLRGLAWGGLQAHTQGEVEGSGWGVSRPKPEGGCIPSCTEDPLPSADSYCCGQYASYWNAFLYLIYFSFF